MTSVCHKTTCGDGTVEGFEQCDDHNLIPYDGCSPTCTKETTCSGGTCTAVCGDGLVFPGEQCDDGNLVNGDGCSSTCQIETGWSCTTTTQAPPSSLTIPILYRDMIHENNGSSSPPAGTTANPDFDNPTITSKLGAAPIVTGLVKSTLDSHGEPQFLSATGSSANALLLNSSGTTTAGDQDIVFCWWFHETGCNGTSSTNPYDKLVYLDSGGKPTTLTLTTTLPATSSSVYTFTSTNFFPIDGLGWNATAATTQADVGGTDNASHNFSFTSELHYVFTYSSSASPVFTFTGDDE
jgi:cysteine-rich repeat protein